MPNDAANSVPTGDGVLSAEEMARQRKLKGVVIGLGLLILLAFAGVVLGMVYRASRIGKAPAVSATTAASPPVTAAAGSATSAGQALLPEIKLSLPRGNEVKSATLQGNRLLVHHDGPAGGGFLVVDLATGVVVSRVTVERER